MQIEDRHVGKSMRWVISKGSGNDQEVADGIHAQQSDAGHTKEGALKVSAIECLASYELRVNIFF